MSSLSSNHVQLYFYRELTPENGYTIAHGESVGSGITGNNKDEIEWCKNYARRCIVDLAKRASVVSFR